MTAGVPHPARRVPHPPGAAVDRLHGQQRPQRLRPLLPERPRPHRRGVRHHRARRLPQPRRDRRLPRGPPRRPPGDHPGLRRPRRRDRLRPGGRAVPHRGGGAARGAADRRARPATWAWRPTCGGGARSRPSTSNPTSGARAPRIILDARRFAQVGTWEGSLRVDDRTWERRPRHVGRHPGPLVGHPPGRRARAAGRAAAEMPADYGFWWTYVPMRFDDFALLFICQEDGAGHRIAERRRAGVARRPGRAAGLAPLHDPLPAGDPAGDRRHHHRHRRGRQAAGLRGAEPGLHRPLDRARLRRRPRVEPRAVDGPGPRRRRRARLHRDAVADRATPPSRCSTTSAMPPATAPRLRALRAHEHRRPHPQRLHRLRLRRRERLRAAAAVAPRGASTRARPGA